MTNIAQIKADIEIVKREIRYARQEETSDYEMELLYQDLEELTQQLHTAVQEHNV